MKKYTQHHAELIKQHKMLLAAMDRASTHQEFIDLYDRSVELLNLMGSTTKAMGEASQLHYTTKGDFSNVGAVGSVRF